MLQHILESGTCRILPKSIPCLREEEGEEEVVTMVGTSMANG
jgi:hypothetical protein